MKRTILGILAATVLAQGATVKTVCASGCNYTTVQAAVTAASFGWIIEVKAGETFSGEVQLKKKTGTPAYITIRSSAIGALPSGVRVTPSSASSMPKLQNTSLVITVEKGASYYRLEGLDIAPTPGPFVYFLVALYPQTSTGGIDTHERADQPHHIIIDRCYIHGIAGQDGPRAGVFLETGYTEITNSWIGEIKDANGEAKAILSQSGSGPFVFRNNHFEAVSITSLMGGGDSAIAGVRPTNLTFLGNHYYRPWKWRVRDVSSAPTGACRWDANGGEFVRNTTPDPDTYWECQSGTWTEILVGAYPTLVYGQKNQFELKNASQVLFDGNLIENAWHPGAAGQRGAAVLFNQVGYSVAAGVYDAAQVVSWTAVQNNRVKNTDFGAAIGGNGEPHHQRMHGLRFDNNLWEGLAWGVGWGAGQVGLIQTGAQNERTYFTHNTFLDSAATGEGNIALMTASGSDFTYEMGWVSNVSGFLSNGFIDAEKGKGALNNAIAYQWDNASRLLSKSVFVDTQDKRDSLYWGQPVFNLWLAGDYPAPCRTCAIGTKAVEWVAAGGPWYWDNGGTNDVGFEDFMNGNYRLKSTSPYKRWSHLGRDPGADVDVVEWSTAHTADGANNPYLDFRVRAVTPAVTSASLRFTAYDVSSCRLTASDRLDFATTVFETTDGGGSRDRTVEIAGLSANTRYFYRIICAGSYRRDGVFLTAP